MPQSDAPGPVITVRLISQHPDRKTIEGLRARVAEFALEITSADDRSIEVQGPPGTLEEALNITIVEQDHVFNVVDGPNITLEDPGSSVSAYIPRRPDFF